MLVLNRPVLVLNKVWIPIRVISAKRCLKLVFANKASIVDPEDYSVYDWEEWKKLDHSEDNISIKTTSGSVKLPEVMVLLSYDKVFIRSLRLTKKNIYMRDEFQCQYTGESLHGKDADIDHVIPRSRGGKNTWENMVVCSKSINRKKADRTPEEAGLKLIKKPSKPKSEHFFIDPKIDVPSSWGKFIQRAK